MREHKYKAWDRRNKTMIGPYTLKDLDNGVFGYYRVIHPPSGMVIQPFEDFDWLEFTGLSDKKNGKEVYECDLVRDQFGLIYKVQIGIYCNGKHLAYGVFASPKDGDGFTLYDPDEFIEVIGNIYENPEIETVS